MIVKMKDITSRLKPAIIQVKESYNIDSIPLYDKNESFLENNAFYVLHNWVNLDENTNIAYNKALDIFIDICENCNESKANDAFDFIFSEIFKVRDAKQLQNSIKYKTSRLKTKISTKIKNNHNDTSTVIGDSIRDLNSKLKTSLPTVQSNTSNNNNDKDAKTEEYLNLLLNKSKILCEADRIIKNYNTILKRFDIDKIVSEIYSEDDIYLSINEICNCINTYDSPFKNKYNTALETVWYSFNKSYMNYPSEKIIESVTDYFIFNSIVNENDIESIKNNNVIFEESDFDCINYLFLNESRNALTVIDDYESKIIVEETIKQKLKDDINKVANDAKKWPKGNPEENKDQDIKDMINNFRSECAKNKSDDKSTFLVNKFKSLINKIFATKPENIVNEIPGMFSIIRTTFIFGATALHPVLGIISLITDFILKNTTERKQCEQYIKKYESEIDLMQNKLNKTKDKYNRERYEKYIEELKKDLSKIKEFENSLYTDEENDEREENKSSYKYDDDFDIDFDNDTFDESQLNNIASILTISELLYNLSESLINNNVDGIVYKNIFKFPNDVIDDITDFAITVPEILEKNELCSKLESYREELRKQDHMDYLRIDCLNDNIRKIKESNDIYNTNNDIKSIICTLMWLDEVTKFNEDTGYVNEMNFTNTLKLALNRLKDATFKLSSKEKQISNNIDIAVNNVAKGIEAATKTNNREAILRGKVIPSASKAIKLALVSGAIWAVNPAVAVIGVLGTFACYKKNSAKERQLVLDDIEIELKMCERYLKLAEEKNDMKAIRQIEIIQRNLLRQQQRIKYKMKVYYNQNTPSVNKDED